MKKSIIILIVLLLSILVLSSCNSTSPLINKSWYIYGIYNLDGNVNNSPYHNDDFLYTDDLVLQFFTDNTMTLTLRDGSIINGKWENEKNTNTNGDNIKGYINVTLSDDNYLSGKASGGVLTGWTLILTDNTHEYRFYERNEIPIKNNYAEMPHKFLPWTQEITDNNVSSVFIYRNDGNNNETIYKAAESDYFEGNFGYDNDGFIGLTKAVRKMFDSVYFKRSTMDEEYTVKENLHFIFTINNKIENMYCKIISIEYNNSIDKYYLFEKNGEEYLLKRNSDKNEFVYFLDALPDFSHYYGFLPENTIITDAKLIKYNVNSFAELGNLVLALGTDRADKTNSISIKEDKKEYLTQKLQNLYLSKICEFDSSSREFPNAEYHIYYLEIFWGENNHDDYAFFTKDNSEFVYLGIGNSSIAVRNSNGALLSIFDIVKCFE